MDITRRDTLLGLGGLAVATAAGGLVRPASAAEAMKLRFAQFTPPTHFYHQRILTPWQEQVAKATNGSVNVEFTGAFLGPMARNFEFAKTGVADIAAGNHGATPGRFVATQITEQPFIGTTDCEPVSVAFWRTHQKFLKDANEHPGTQLLSLHVSGPLHLFSVEKPIRSLADIKGMKILTTSGVSNEVVEALGGVSLVKAVPEFYELLSKGVVDGVMTTNTAIKGWRAEEFIKYQLLVPGGMMFVTFFVTMNEKKWNDLSPEQQKAIMDVTGEKYAALAGSVFTEEDKKAVEARKAGTTQVIEASGQLLEDLKKSLGFIEANWLKNAKQAGVKDPAMALAFFKEQVGSYKR